MTTKIIQPLWYHPTNVMLIDDDTNLLESLVMKIDKDFSVVTFSSPKEALEHLKKNALPLEKLSQSIMSDIAPSEEKHLSSENVAINFSPLHANLDKTTRFTRTVTVVVDRAMKEMDGLDFCRKVRELGLPVKLILLTGHTGMDEAVVAFNDAIIDAFVEKSSEVAVIIDQVNSYIKRLSFKAFCDASAKLLGPILNRFSFLTSKAYAEFLKTMYQKYNIIEHIIIDSSGSCLLITSDGVVRVVLIKADHDFKDAYDIAISGDAANADVLEDLKNRRAFPFTGIEYSHFNFDVTQWKNTMVLMQKQEALHLYFGVTKVPKSIMSFDHYAHEIWESKASSPKSCQ